MTRLEMVEQIREKTGVTYDVAKEALESCDWDMLDAIIALEKPDFSVAREMGTEKLEAPKRATHKASIALSDAGSKFSSIIKMALKLALKGESIRMEIYRKDEFVESVSLTVLVLLLLIEWWIPVGLIALGLFTGFKFHFIGAGKLVNTIAEKTGEKAEEFKSKFEE